MTTPEPKRRKTILERNPVVVGVLGLLLLSVLGGLAFFSNDLPVIGAGTRYSADFTEAAGIRPDNEVRISGVKVGVVTGTALEGDHVHVTFRVRGAWIGDRSTAAIKIKTLLGEKYLSVDPLGSAEQNPDQAIPVSRTVTPFDVTDAFNGLTQQVGQIDTQQLAQSFTTIADTFARTSPQVNTALSGLASLSRTISSRDSQLAELLAGTKKITQTLADRDDQFQALLTDGNLLLSELTKRREAIGALLTGAQQLATQLSGLVNDNTQQLAPALQQLQQVTGLLQRNQDNLDRSLRLAGPYYRMLGNAVGNGRWLDTYLCGLVPTEGASGCTPPRIKGGS
ncbi:MCE family protein [Kutzneria viridogrisea]|uniref:Phospholipid/cholesterol/gamma-HCH transport system substrate-binding protein n=1 Tax=Kutzneria viridogrisea TaxID=47990 RepID=A0ABR6BDI5_9PSEU|nr:phospholipid/cholesterol/gamma-HCH transport system substrate-binding protein [Kutzneria viridogrisea]